MRVKNKEIRSRRHRKEQKIKEANRLLKAQYSDKKDSPAPKTPTAKAPAKPAAKKPAAKKKAEA